MNDTLHDFLYIFNQSFWWIFTYTGELCPLTVHYSPSSHNVMEVYDCRSTVLIMFACVVLHVVTTLTTILSFTFIWHWLQSMNNCCMYDYCQIVSIFSIQIQKKAFLLYSNFKFKSYFQIYVFVKCDKKLWLIMDITCQYEGNAWLTHYPLSVVYYFLR